MTSVVPETIATATTGLDRAPKGLLLDFGGVIILTQKRLQGRAEFAAKLQSRLQAAGIEISAEVLEGCLAAGATALKHWKHASSRRRQPRELTVEEILGEFYFGDLPEPARLMLTTDGAELLDEMSTALTDHNIRPGARELIDYAQAQGIALGVVSNAHSGRAHRRILTELGIHDAFGVQIYSDEAGIRKPHPQMLGRAATALGVDLADCWYVGDTLDRDLVAGRRSGVGAVVLTRSQHTHEPPFPINDEPEAVVEDPAELLTLLQEVTEKTDDDAPGHTAANGTASAGTGQVTAIRTASGVRNKAILLDHGGVVSRSTKPVQPFAAAGQQVETVLTKAGCPVDPGRGLEIILTAHEQYKLHKSQVDETEAYREITARQYWGEFTAAAEVTEQQRQALLAEAEQLQLGLYHAKSDKAEREGIRQLLEFCSETGRRVIVVSNTICGTGVRSIIRGYGLGEHIAGWVCSDEYWLKKPRP